MVKTSNYATCNVYSPKAVATLIQKKMLQILFSLLFVKYIFFWFYRSTGFKENIKYAKQGNYVTMECADETVFTFAM